MDSEHRRRSRVTARFEAAVTLGRKKIKVITRNLSLKGMLCNQDSNIHTGELGNVILTLGNDIKLRIKSLVIRSDETGVAIDFMSMNEESFFHLRNIVRLSAQDPDLIDQELSVPAFIASADLSQN